MPRVIEIPNLDHLIRRYQAGESELKLAREFGIGRKVIRRRLLAAGIIPRNRSQANFTSMSRMSPLERMARVSAAHKAAKGRKATVAERELRARTVERKCIGVSRTESIFADMLIEKGVSNLVHQKAIGIYNIDIAIEEPRIAVEIYGGNFHTHFSHSTRALKRFPYLFNDGWSVVVIWVDGGNHPLTLGAADYIVTFIKHLRSNKSKRCEYRVIGGDGELITTTSKQLNYLSTVVSPTHSH